MFLAMLMFLFVIEAAGRSLGLDAWLRHKVPAVRDGRALSVGSSTSRASHHLFV